MSPAQRHGVVLAAAAAPLVAYQARELAQGIDGWPISRFARLLPLWLFLSMVAGFFGWFVPHIALRRTS